MPPERRRPGRVPEVRGSAGVQGAAGRMSGARVGSLAAAVVAASALALFPASPLRAQTAILTGRVVDAETRAPMAGALVRVYGRAAGILSEGDSLSRPDTVTPGEETGGSLGQAASGEGLTGEDGRFRIEGLAPGMVRVRAEFLGYTPAVETSVMLRTSRPTYVALEMVPRALEVEGITVAADVFRSPEDAPASAQRLSEVEIRRTPGAIGDIARSLLSLPGVLSGVDNRNDILVRGGGPAENAYYLDGIRIPQINHFATQGTAGGALALVNADFIQDVTFFTGGFPVTYGDALSSVLLVENRPGNADGLAGDVTLGASEAGITLDGPLGGAEGNWLFSVRRSYLQFLFEALDLPIRPDYWDGQVSVNWEPTARDRFTLTGIGAIDEFGIIEPGPDADYENREIFQSVLDNDQKAFTLGGTWRRLVGEAGVVRLRVGHSRTDYRFRDLDSDEELLLANRSVEGRSRVRLEGERRVSATLRLGGGVEAVRVTIQSDVFQRALPGGLLEDDVSYDTGTAFWKPGLWGRAIWRRNSLTATGGVRADGVTALDQSWTLSPRGSVSLDMGGGVELKAAGGLFHQAPSALALSVEEEGERINTGLKQLRNWQVVAGADWRAGPGLRLRLESFYKEYDRMPVLAVDPRVNLANLGDDYGFVGAQALLPEGEGRAWGAELFGQQKLTDDLYFLGAYTLSWSEYAGADGVLKPSAWDRRHALDLTGGYRPGATWEIGAKLRLLSGQAVTPWDMEASAQTYPVSGRGVRDWSRAGELRSPVYARLDLRVEREWFFQGWDAVVYLDLQNVLNRTNTVGFAYTEDPAYPDRLRPLDSVAFLPTFGFSVEF